jgi:hypothetical protein
MFVLNLVVAGTMVQLTAGYYPPDRLVHRYDIECGGRSGSVILEERFDRSPPSETVRLTSFTPFGAPGPLVPTPELEQAFSRMARVQRVSWMCGARRALVVIEYTDRQSVERAARPGTRPGRVAMTTGRLFLHMDENGFRPERR